MNIIKFCEVDQWYTLSCQKTSKISRAIVRVTPEVNNAT